MSNIIWTITRNKDIIFGAFIWKKIHIAKIKGVLFKFLYQFIYACLTAGWATFKFFFVVLGAGFVVGNGALVGGGGTVEGLETPFVDGRSVAIEALSIVEPIFKCFQNFIYKNIFNITKRKENLQISPMQNTINENFIFGR